MKEKITKEYLYKLHIIEGRSINEISNITGMANPTVKKRMNEYGIEIMKPNWKKISKRMQKTCMKKYGRPYPLDVNKAAETLKKNYGVLNPQKSRVIRERAEETCMKKYGVRNASMCEDVKAKVRNTNLKKFGTSVYPQHEHISDESLNVLNSRAELEKILNNMKSVKLVAEHLGVTPRTVYLRIHAYNIDTREFYISNRSAGEMEIENFIRTIYDGEIETNNRTVLGGNELDIWLPDKNIAIEYNGNFWHSDVKKEKTYAVRKYEMAARAGVRLIQIQEWQWHNDEIRERLENLIRGSIATRKKIRASKLSVVVPKKETTRQFLDDNHLSGNVGYSFSIGLEDTENGELLAVMTFGKPRFRKNIDWEILRFATRADTQIYGAASKMFSEFLKMKNPKSVISYSNNSFFNGNTYKMLGFSQQKRIVPNYVWVRGIDVRTRYQSQRKRISGIGSENDIMRSEGWNKLYDAGSTTWIWEEGET